MACAGFPRLRRIGPVPSGRGRRNVGRSRAGIGRAISALAARRTRRHRFRPDLSGALRDLAVGEGRADVIKIEPPHGEPLRRRATPGKSATLPFAMLNQNKRAVTLNLKHPRGRELLFEMVRRADVLLENFSPGTMDDLGVGWSVLRELNPRLIYATGTGFGISGPDRDNLAMDLTIQAASGIMSVTGAPDGPPMKAGPTLVGFHGRDPPLRRRLDRALRPRPQRRGQRRRTACLGGDAGDRLFEPRGEL